MKILTKNNVIIELSNKADIVFNGIKLDNYILAISVNDNGEFCEDIPLIYDLENIPENIIPHKYCYTKEKGFYINNNYINPVSQEEFDKFKKENEEMKQAIAELSAMLATGGVQ